MTSTTGTGFRRNAAHFPPDKLVQHEVADDENALRGRATEDLGETRGSHAKPAAAPRKKLAAHAARDETQYESRESKC